MSFKKRQSSWNIEVLPLLLFDLCLSCIFGGKTHFFQSEFLRWLKQTHAIKTTEQLPYWRFFFLLILFYFFGTVFIYQTFFFSFGLLLFILLVNGGEKAACGIPLVVGCLKCGKKKTGCNDVNYLHLRWHQELHFGRSFLYFLSSIRLCVGKKKKK